MDFFWWVLSIGLILLGILPHLEKIFKLDINKNFRFIIFLLFLILSISQIGLTVYRQNISKEEFFKLKQQVLPRVLTADQRDKLKGVLKDAVKEKIVVSCRLMDGESCDYAKQIQSVFEETGWHTYFNKTSVNDLIGVVAVFNSGDNESAGTDSIIKAFDSANINGQVNKMLENSIGEWFPNTVYIVVGRKNVNP